MRKLGLLIIGLVISNIIFGQTIKLQMGTSISQLDWKLKNINIDPIYNKTLIGYSLFAGCDYMDKKHYNLSSNIGLISKGGKSETQLSDRFGEYTGQTITEKPTLNYLSINTTFDLKYRIGDSFLPFISLGPRIDYLTSYSSHFDGLKGLGELKNWSTGLLLGGGLKYDLNKIQIGLRADYYLNFTKIADWTIEQTLNGGEVTVNTFAINVTIGYKIK